MKTIKKSFCIVLLYLLLSISAIAGDMPGGVIYLPSPDHPQSLAPNESSTTSSVDTAVVIDPFTEIVLNVIQSTLSLF